MNKRKQPNISTLSLRSASRKTRSTNKRSLVHTNSNSRSNNQLTPTNASKKSNSSSTKPPSSIIGKSSRKSITCKGCNVIFNVNADYNNFIKNHVMTSTQCSKAYPKCVHPCNKIFFDQKHLLSHQKNRPKTSICNRMYSQLIVSQQFMSSNVIIPSINSFIKSPTDIPKHLNALYDVQKDLMNLKQQSDYSKFVPTMKFLNTNIHNTKTVIPSQFMGHAIMDPEALHLKKNIVTNGIYCLPTNDDIEYCEAQLTNTQVVDFGDCGDSLINNGPTLDVQSELSSNSSKDSSHVDSSNSNSNHYSNELIQAIIDNDSVNEDNIINTTFREENVTHSHLPNEESIDNDSSNANISDINISSDDSSHSNEQELNELPPQQESVVVLNDEHFLNMLKLQKKELSNGICDEDYKDSLELVKILMKHNIPVNKIYTELMQWKNKKRLTSTSMTIPSLIDKAEYRVYGKSITTKMKPIMTNLTCPSGRRVTVTSFDIDAQIFDMLNHHDLMQPHNMIFPDGNESNPFKLTSSESYGDIDTSEFYIETWKQKILDPESELLVPIQIYMDETTIDTYSHLQLHPLVMTMLILNRKTRNLSMSWRTLAYIPNFDSMFEAKTYSVQAKHNDFHFCLRYLLSGIEVLQSTADGYFWDFNFDCYPDKTFRRKLKFVLGNVLGDAKGNNVLCSRYGNNCFTTHVARDCDVRTEDCDDHKHKCCFHKQKDLDKLDVDGLKKLSFRKASPYNAFSNIDFGANCYGINGACAADPCHMFNKGVVERLPQIFMARLPPKLIKLLDKHVGALVTNYSNQSDRRFPNIKIFSKGVSSSSKLRSDQHIARLLVIYLVLLSVEFEKEIINKKGRKESKEQERTKITLNEYNGWVLIFEETLILHSWVYLDTHPKNAFKGGKNSIVCDRLREYMNTYKENALRKEGMGMKFLKFHQILHLWWIIRLFGSLYNVDTARCESHHKKKKIIGKQTQRRIELFDEQTSNGEYKYNLLVKAMEKAYIPLPKLFEMTTSSGNSTKNLTQTPTNNTIEIPTSKNQHGSKFILTFDYQNQTSSAKWTTSKMKNKSPQFPTHILDAIYTKFKGYNHGIVGKRLKSINGFTEYKLTNEEVDEFGTIIRACPNYRNEKHWFDWVQTNWDGEGLLEGQCLLFLDFNSIEMERVDNNVIEYEGGNEAHTPLAYGNAVLIHSTRLDESPSFQRPCCQKSNTTVEEANFVTNRLLKFLKMETTYQIIEVDNIHRSSFVIPYEYNNINETYLPGCAKSVMVMMPMVNWHKLFIDYSNKTILDDGSKRVDNDIDNLDERYPFEG